MLFEQTSSVSDKAKALSIEVINQYQLQETGLLGFWIGFPSYPDYMALALFINKLIDKHDVKVADDVRPYLQTKLPIYQLSNF